MMLQFSRFISVERGIGSPVIFQQAMVAEMQTPRDLYDVLNYHAFEEKLDELFAKRKRQ
jgi:hypothetical protein